MLLERLFIYSTLLQCEEESEVYEEKAIYFFSWFSLRLGSLVLRKMCMLFERLFISSTLMQCEEESEGI